MAAVEEVLAAHTALSKFAISILRDRHQALDKLYFFLDTLLFFLNTLVYFLDTLGCFPDTLFCFVDTLFCFVDTLFYSPGHLLSQTIRVPYKIHT